jgi:hypothetical protein
VCVCVLAVAYMFVTIVAETYYAMAREIQPTLPNITPTIVLLMTECVFCIEGHTARAGVIGNRRISYEHYTISLIIGTGCSYSLSTTLEGDHSGLQSSPVIFPTCQ